MRRRDSSRDTVFGRLHGYEWEQQRSTQAARTLRRRPTRSENLLWQALRNRQVDGAKFRRQHQIGPFVVDFCCTKSRLIVEIDGPIHGAQLEEDQARQLALERLGFTFLRITAENVERDLPAVLGKIAEANQMLLS
jgi:phosphoribosylformylglycinamidine synthase